MLNNISYILAMNPAERLYDIIEYIKHSQDKEPSRIATLLAEMNTIL